MGPGRLGFRTNKREDGEQLRVIEVEPWDQLRDPPAVQLIRKLEGATPTKYRAGNEGGYAPFDWDPAI